MQGVFAALQHFAFGNLFAGEKVGIFDHWSEQAECLAMRTDIKAERAQPQLRNAYPVFRSITTRWADNDVYGHVNNVVYYSWFDTAVNAYLISQGALDIHGGHTIGLVVETQCNYFAPLAFPQIVDAGVRVARLGESSVRYEVGLFGAGEPLSAAAGYFVHVYVDRDTRRPVPLPARLRTVLQALLPVAPGQLSNK